MIDVKVMKQRSHLCPMCNKGKIIVEDTNADDVDIQIINPESNRKAKWYIKCPVCKNQIGFSFKR